MIRAITQAEVADLVQLQLKALPGSLPSKFGTQFLDLYNRSFLTDPEFFCDGYYFDSLLVGFMAYSSNTHAVFARALKQNFWEFTRTLSRSILRRPQRLLPVMRLAVSVIARRHEPGENVQAELISLGVLPEFRRSSQFYKQHGVAVSLEIVHHAFDVLRGRGVRQIKIFTKQMKDDSAINAFWGKEGFEFVGTVKRYGVMANLHIKNLPHF